MFYLILPSSILLYWIIDLSLIQGVILTLFTSGVYFTGKKVHGWRI